MPPEHPLVLPLAAGLALGWGMTAWFWGQAARCPLAARRPWQMLSLVLPVLFGGFVWWHLWEDAGALDWAMLLGSLCTSGLAVVACAAGLLRHLYLERLLWAYSQTDATTERLQHLAKDLAIGLGMRPVPVRRLPTARPAALVVGLVNPVVYLSDWYCENLTDCQLRLVLAHEFAHAVRKDNLVGVWAWALTLGGWYLPSSWRVLRALRRERELAADDLAARTGADPLGLARLLLQVFEAACDLHRLPTSAFEQRAFVQERIERLLEPGIGEDSAAETACAGNFGWPFWVGCFGLAAVAYLGTNTLPHLLSSP